MNKTADIAIIGAGLTGLTTAFYLKKQNKNFVVLEEKDRIGGVIHTVQENGFTYEEGPNTGVLGNPDAAELFEDLNGLCTCELANKNVSKRYILKNGNWEQMPLSPLQAIKTPLFATKDKFRILGEPFRKKGTNADETLSELVKRRMGNSFLDYAIDPFILGVYAGDPSKLITRFAFPKLYNLEQTYGSFIGGSIKKMFSKKDERDKKATRKVFSAKGGLSNLTGAVYKAAGTENFILNVKNIQLQPTEDGFQITGTFQNENINILAKKVITTTGAYILDKILPFADKTLMDKIQKVKYAKVVQGVIGFKKWEGMPLDGFGGLIPFVERRDILGVLFISSLLADRAPEGGALCSVFTGGVRREELVDKTDDEIREIIKREFTSVMKLKDFNPDLFKIIRYQHAIPQYGIESAEKMQTIAQLEKAYPGLIIGGNLKDGIGMADRIKQGKHLSTLV
jgi:oxygen-dependent protoporphyrinogen oxidase